MKYCSKCNQTKDYSLFSKNKNRKDGLQANCKECRTLMQFNYRRSNKEKANNTSKKFREQNRESFLNTLKKYRETEHGKSKRCFLEQKRKANLLKRIPKWLSEDEMWLIEEVFKLASLRTKTTNIKWQVDHIIPLQGETVSGLHCPENLQVIPAIDNMKKNNRWDWDTQQ